MKPCEQENGRNIKVGEEYYFPLEGWCLLANIFESSVLFYRLSDHVEIIANRDFMQQAKTAEIPPQKIRFSRFNFTMGDDCFYLSHGEYPSVCKAVIRSGMYLGSDKNAVVSLVDSRKPTELLEKNCRDVWCYAL